MTLQNPYLDAFNAPVTDEERKRLGLDGLSSNFAERYGSHLVRYSRRGVGGERGLADRYSWAIPNESAIRHIARLSPIVEVCAGRGYWAWLLQQAGADVLAYDIAPPSPTSGKENFWHQTPADTFTTVRRGSAELVALAHGAERTLMICWPPYSDPTASLALKAYERVGGRNVVYIGEGEGGCTGDGNFHSSLEERWEEVEGCRIPQWDGIHDRVHCYTRRR